MKTELKWKKTKAGNEIYQTEENKKLFLSYRSNSELGFMGHSNLDSANPETAIVLLGHKKDGGNRFLINAGDHRKEMQELYPSVEKLIKYWKQSAPHFWTDSLED